MADHPITTGTWYPPPRRYDPAAGSGDFLINPPFRIMNNDHHPITPPPELVQQWIAEIWHEGTPVRVAASDLHIATQAARWGADQELEACCEYMQHEDFHGFAKELRAARRPEPSMTDAPQDQHLWRVMNQAYDTSSHPQWEEHHGMAAEIRAVADWLVPRAWLEEESKRGEFADFRVRKWIRQRLLAEADRAERGEA